jgi:aryl-alcohol dehydrogenase-like predicted oxidoreductase
MQYRALGNTGLKVSALSFGASPLGGAFRDVDESEALRAVHLSLEKGINFVDVSPFYGLTKSETVLGKALRTIPRGTYMLSTKVGRYGHEPKDFDFSAKRVTASIDESLARLHVSYVDVLLAHDVEFGSLDQVINETIPAMQKIKQAGKTRFIGISALPLKCFQYVSDRVALDVILSYCHYSLNDTALEGLVPQLKAKKIGIINASPLSMGLLSQRGAPDWHPAPANVKAQCALAAEHCQKRGASIEKLAVQYAISNPQIATTLVGSANPRNMERNIAWASEPIDQTLLTEVLEILKPIHDVTWPSGRAENN